MLLGAAVLGLSSMALTIRRKVRHQKFCLQLPTIADTLSLSLRAMKSFRNAFGGEKMLSESWICGNEEA
jgi:Flp pilus assembly protein TadB